MHYEVDAAGQFVIRVQYDCGAIEYVQCVNCVLKLLAGLSMKVAS